MEKNKKEKIKLKDKIMIPKYTLGEELVSSITHGIGVIFGIVALVLCVVFSCMSGDPWKVASSIIYGTTMILLYTMSTLYHSLKVNNAKRVFRIIDHCTIYLLIAGTYTPYTLITLKGTTGWLLFGFVWASAIIGIIFNAIDLKKYKVISMISYLVMGWVIIFAFKPLIDSLSNQGFLLLISGGIVYTIGAILYGLGKKYKYMHSIFHIFVLAASILHFFSILLYVIL